MKLFMALLFTTFIGSAFAQENLPSSDLLFSYVEKVKTGFINSQELKKEMDRVLVDVNCEEGKAVYRVVGSNKVGYKTVCTMSNGTKFEVRIVAKFKNNDKGLKFSVLNKTKFNIL